MAPPIKPDIEFFVLTKLPMAVCPFCDSEMDWPTDIVWSGSAHQDWVDFNSRSSSPARLQLGTDIDEETGFVSRVRLEDAIYGCLRRSRLGHNPWPLVAGRSAPAPGGAAAIVLLVALAVALGVAVSAQERALRQGSARAADAFDLSIGAPGSETQLVLSTVYLQPAAIDLIDGRILAD